MPARLPRSSARLNPMADFKSKLVNTFHYHLWTDALHLRAIAREAGNRWNRGTYVRCTLTNAWTVLETACNDALDVTDIGYSFRKNLDRAVEQKKLPSLDWSQGIWKDVTNLQQLRKEFVHQGISDRNRFAEASQADMAIDVCRRAIKAIYAHTGKPAAAVWVDDDFDPGFDIDKGLSISISGDCMLIEAGADPNHRDTIRAAYVYKDKEHISGCYPVGTDHKPLIDDLVRSIRVPISAVRAYRGNELLEERKLLMRGN
jgi:hypothetical protein